MTGWRGWMPSTVRCTRRFPGTDLSLFGAIAFIQRELQARRSGGADQ